jgi:PPOX class probable FMN-dependent enzyme
MAQATPEPPGSTVAGMTDRDAHSIDSVARLRDVIGEPGAGIELKVYDALTEEARAYIDRSPFLVLSSADRDGRLDASPKGDAPGFVLVEDDHTIVIPDRPGNKLAYGLTNVIDNPHVGVLFMIPGTTETLRVNGSAELRNDPELLERLAARGKPAVLAIRVTVEECFFHCSKAFIRSNLWKPDSWPEKQKISFGQMLARRIAADDPDLPQVIDDMVEADYRTNL